MSLNAITFIILNLAFYPRLQRRYGTMKIYVACVASMAPLVLFFPLTHYFAVREQPIMVVLGLSCLVILKCCGGLVWP